GHRIVTQGQTELLLSARELLLRATETLLGPQNCYSGTDRIVTECQIIVT
ncbi:unnamed protein product, partial [Staurois parvus]